MQRRKLGGLEVAAIGLGCMSMTPIYGEPSEPEAIATIHRAAELGVDLVDTSDAYGNGANEELVGRAIKGVRDKIVLATKFGQVRSPGGAGVNGRPEYVRSACEASLARLGVDHIDLYYIHRIDPAVPIEETVGAMARLKDEGKIGHLGISEAAPATLRRAHRTHKMAALQTEYSLWTRDAEEALLDTCAELGIGYVAYAPLGRGFLTATIKSEDALDARTQGPAARASALLRRQSRAQCAAARGAARVGPARARHAGAARARVAAEPAAVHRAAARDEAAALARGERRRRRDHALDRDAGRPRPRLSPRRHRRHALSRSANGPGRDLRSFTRGSRAG